MRSTHHTDTIRLMANYVVSATKRIGRRLLCAPLVKRAVSLWHRRGVPKAVLGVATIALTFGLFRLTAMAAPDLLDDWTFTTPSDYTYSSGVEIAGGIAQLKAQNYTTDGNTQALYHLDETGGTNVSDSSANNNAATLHDGSFVTGNLNTAASLNDNTGYIRVPQSPSLNLGQQHTIEAWTKFDIPFNNTDQSKRHQIVDKGSYQLYYDNETGKLTYELEDQTATTWSQVAGGDINGGWDSNGKLSVNAMVKVGLTTYAAIGNTVGDAEVWAWNGTSWSLVGGGPQSVNDSWAALTYEGVYSLTTDGTNLYAGLGASTADGEVWRYDGTSWAKIGGDSLNGGWTNYVEYAWSLDYLNGILYAGIGTGANDAEVWSWNGTSWTKIGGDSLNGGWTTNYEVTASLTNDGTNLYAGMGVTAGDSEVWSWNGTSWTKIGGDSLNGSWDATIETVRSLRYFGGTLYAGLGDTAGDAEVWSWNGTSWTKIGGDSVSGSWPTSTYEQVTAFAHDGSNLYAGLGTSNGDGEVWRYDGTSWVKIGGDAVNNSWASAWGDSVNALLWDGTHLLSGTYDTAGSGWVYTWDGTTWNIIGGDHINKSWGFYGYSAVQVMQPYGDHLYAGMGGLAGGATVWQYNSSKWSIIGGQGINSSWTPNTYESVLSMATYKGKLYVGLGSTAAATINDGEVWSWDGTTWTKVAGGGLNDSWPFSASHYGEVSSLAADNDYLYAGLGAGSADGEVWRYDGTSWIKIGGDSINSGWTNYVENIYAMGIYGGNLAVGLGRSAGDGEVWQWDGTAWAKIGGDGLSGSWASSYSVETMTIYDNQLCVGLGNVTGSAALWCWDGTTWTNIGGDGVNDSWMVGTYEKLKTITTYNGKLYAGLGNSTGDGEVWQWDGTAWAKIGGNGINSGWGGTVEEIESFSSYKGKLYAGTGLTANADATVWSWGNNAFLQSSLTSFDTNWHHVAASYDGSTLKLYVDGALTGSLNRAVTVATNSKDLLIGAGYGGREQGKPQSRFVGSLDEIRLSNVARTSFTTTPYSTEPQTISPTTSVRKTGVWHWDTLSHTQAPGGGTITYRLSNNEGESWLYWDGTGWAESTSTAMANTQQIITDNFASFPVTFRGMLWQAVLNSNGVERTSIDGVSTEATSDTSDPSSNAQNISAYKANGGAAITSGSWTNGSSPYFTWDAATDAGAGTYGYCVYLGTDASADPATSKGLLGNSPKQTGGHCEFIVPTPEIDLATPGYLGSALATSNDTYYLTLRAIDGAGNIINSSEQFNFKFDNTTPSNPGFITAPSGFINTKAVEMSWPGSGVNAAQDAHSGIAGLQYRIGIDGQWYGDAHNGNGDMSDLLANDGVYQTLETPDYANLIDGINTVYFRTWDHAGNYTTTYATATLKINTSGAPSEPTNLVALPPSNTTNSFGFNWDEPVTYVGNVTNIVYCYTVNTAPSSTTCNYTAAGSTELTVGPYATQPGVNTLYVAARDESGNINYANFATVTFTANTTAPGMPLNNDIVDVSIKNTNNWRLALTWDQPLTGSVSSYKVYRSTNGTDFSMVGTSTSTTYIDAGLSQQNYYYQVAACDNTNNCGASGSMVQEFPTGKFTSPATIVSGPSVSDITTKHATINWSTDRASDSKVSIGTASGSYAASEVGNSSQVSAHTITLDNLAPGTTYYYKVKWTDEDGNTGTSQEATFTTAPAPVTKEVSVYDINLSSASVSFTTRGATKAKIYYGTSESFGGLKEINTSEAESLYDVLLPELSDGTKYYYMISTIDKEGTEYRGQISSFTTPQRPRIANLRFQPIDGEPTSTQSVTWTTNVPSSSSVTYALINGSPIEVNDAKQVTEHTIIIRNLRDDSQYTLIAQSRDASGNVATSDRQSFRTALDTRPPQISNTTIESSIRGSGSEARGQIVVSWQTDEPSTSQLAYTEGSDAQTFNSKTAQDTRLTTEHIVIISDLPTSRVYSVQPVSSDHAQNEGTGETQTAIVGRASDDALTIVFNALKAIFGI